MSTQNAIFICNVSKALILLEFHAEKVDTHGADRLFVGARVQELCTGLSAKEQPSNQRRLSAPFKVTVRFDLVLVCAGLTQIS